LGAINWVQKWYVPGGAWSGEQIAVAMLAMIERMLSARPVPALNVDPALEPVTSYPRAALTPSLVDEP
jgi:hypothetical protein